MQARLASSTVAVEVKGNEVLSATHPNQASVMAMLQEYETQRDQLKQQLEQLRLQQQQQQALQNQQQALKDQLNQLNIDFQLKQQRKNDQQGQREQLQISLKELFEKEKALKLALEQEISTAGLPLPTLGDTDTWFEQALAVLEQAKADEQALTTAQQQQAVIATQLVQAQQKQGDDQNAVEKAQTQLQALQKTEQQKQSERQQLFGAQSVATARETAEQEKLTCKTRAGQIQTQYQAQADQVKAEQARIQTLNSQIQTLQTQYSSLDETWQEQLAASDFATEAVFLAALLDQDELAQLQTQVKAIETELERQQALLSQAESLWQKLKAEGEQQAYITDEIDNSALLERVESTRQKLEQCREEVEQIAHQSGEINALLRDDAQRREAQNKLLVQIATQQQSYDDLAYLNSLIGSQKGDKFRRFAQGLTLDHLVYLANKQLQRLHSRYQLQRKQSEVLELQVADTWQGDSLRDTKTLSGGESFLVSLALALALSDLASQKTRIESLFLDEGFGTLDQETLDIALDALDNLNAAGKMIGVISHIETMKERIPVQIRVQKMNGLGKSRLEQKYAYHNEVTA